MIDLIVYVSGVVVGIAIASLLEKKYGDKIYKLFDNLFSWKDEVKAKFKKGGIR